MKYFVIFLLTSLACGNANDDDVEYGVSQEALKMPVSGSNTWGTSSGPGHAVCNNSNTQQHCYYAHPLHTDPLVNDVVIYDMFIDTQSGGGWGQFLGNVQQEAMYYANEWVKEANLISPPPATQWSVFVNSSPGGNIVFRSADLPTPPSGDNNLEKYVSVSFGSCSLLREIDGFTPVNYPGDYRSCSYAIVNIDWRDLQSRFPTSQFLNNLSQAEQYGIALATGIAPVTSPQQLLEPGSVPIGTGFSLSAQVAQVKKYQAGGWDSITF